MTRASGGDQKSSAGRSTTWTNKFRIWSQNEVKNDNNKRTTLENTRRRSRMKRHSHTHIQNEEE
jgi:hypothetical protein